MSERIVFHVFDLAKSKDLSTPISKNITIGGNNYSVSFDSIYYARGYRRYNPGTDRQYINLSFRGDSSVGTYGKLLIIQVENAEGNKAFYAYGGSGIPENKIEKKRPIVLKDSSNVEIDESNNSPSHIVLIDPSYSDSVRFSTEDLLDTTNFLYAVKNLNSLPEYMTYTSGGDIKVLFYFLYKLFNQVQIGSNTWAIPFDSSILRIPIETYLEVIKCDPLYSTWEWTSADYNKTRSPIDGLDYILETFGDSYLNGAAYSVSKFIVFPDFTFLQVLLTNYPSVRLGFREFTVEVSSFGYHEETIRNSEELNNAFFSKHKECKKVVENVFSKGVSEVVAFTVIAGSDSPSSWEEVERLISEEILSPIIQNDEGPLAKADVDFIVGLLPIGYRYDSKIFGDTLLPTMDTHLQLLSNKSPDFESPIPSERIGQKERYFVVSAPPDRVSLGETTQIYLSEYVASKFANTLGKRTLIFTGNFEDVSIPYLLSDTNSEGKWSVFSNEEVNRYITWQLVGLNAILTYIKSGDPTLPLTQKTVSDINFSGKKIGNYAFSDLVRKGSVVLYSDNPNQGNAVCYRSVLSSFYWYNEGQLMSYPEDIELSILFTEDLMDKENRNFLGRFRGQKMDRSTVAVISQMFKKYVLDSYISRGLIESYGNYWIKADPDHPDRLIGYYKYRPVYPINKIWIEHYFIV